MLLKIERERSAPLRLLFVGHSHLRALKQGYGIVSRRPGADAPQLTAEFLAMHKAAAAKRQQVVADAVDTIAKSSADFVVSCIGGNGHNALGLINHPQRLDFVLPDEPDLPLAETAEILPSGVIRAALRHSVKSHVGLMTRIRSRTAAPMIHLESPPPVPSEEHIREHRSMFSAKIEELGVAPAPLRYKLWRMHSALLRETCETLGITFLPVPRRTQNPDGTLHEKGWNEDATHANRWYGVRAIRHLLNHIHRAQSSSRGGQRRL